MKTQKFFMAIAAMAAVSMSSCSQEEELVSPDNRLSDNAVVFGTYIGKNPASRGSIINNDALKASDSKGFGVMAYYTGENDFGAEGTSQTPNFMYNQQVKWKGEGTTAAWTYSPLKYWPNNNSHKISFFAYAPYVSTGGNEGITALPGKDTSGDPTLTFKMSTDVSKHIDLLYADDVKNQTKGKNVTLTFKHALSRISFQRQALIDDIAENDLDVNTVITIKKVTFKAENLATEGTLNLNTAEWSNLQYGEMNYVINSFTDKSNELKNGDATTAKDLTDANSYIMLIPKVQESRAESGNCKIVIEYEVKTKDSNLTGGYSTVTNTKEVPVSISPVAGKAYKMILKIGMTSVKLDAMVAEWNDDETAGWESLSF